MFDDMKRFLYLTRSENKIHPQPRNPSPFYEKKYIQKDFLRQHYWQYHQPHRTLTLSAWKASTQPGQVGNSPQETELSNLFTLGIIVSICLANSSSSKPRRLPWISNNWGSGRQSRVGATYPHHRCCRALALVPSPIKY